MIVFVDCDNCKHRKKEKIGRHTVCDAFPNGIPFSFDAKNVRNMLECNNGIRYEEKSEE